MKENVNEIIESYRFQDDKKMIINVIVFHMILSALFLMMDSSNLLNDLRTQLCVFISFSFLGLYMFYNWKSPNINVAIASFYGLLILLEFFYLGLPNSPLAVDDRMSRGVLLELLLSTFPLIYLVLRIGVIFPLIKIIFSSRSIDEAISR